MECAFCGGDVRQHDPVCICECADGTASDVDVRFCNYACLRAYIDAEELTTGDRCEWNP